MTKCLSKSAWRPPESHDLFWERGWITAWTGRPKIKLTLPAADTHTHTNGCMTTHEHPPTSAHISACFRIARMICSSLHHQHQSCIISYRLCATVFIPPLICFDRRCVSPIIQLLKFPLIWGFLVFTPSGDTKQSSTHLYHHHHPQRLQEHLMAAINSNVLSMCS